MKTKKTKVLFLHDLELDDREFKGHVFAYFPDKIDHAAMYDKIKVNFMVCYAHVGQHSACHPDYAKECKEANFNLYSWDLLPELIGQGYKNLEIQNSQEFEYHRPPTKGEIKFGEGATHYRSFTLKETGITKKGNLKKWFVADDGLRYYR